jgi:hypothetical protein
MPPPVPPLKTSAPFTDNKTQFTDNGGKNGETGVRMAENALQLPENGAKMAESDGKSGGFTDDASVFSGGTSDNASELADDERVRYVFFIYKKHQNKPVWGWFWGSF